MDATSTTSPSIEVEAKLAPPWDGAPRTREEVGPLPGYRAVPLRAQRIRSTYLDTRERSLARLGVTLRVRTAAGRSALEATWAGTVEGALHSRRRVEAPVASARKPPSRLPPGPLSLHLAPWVARRRLVPFLAIDVRRERLWLFRDGAERSARPVAEIALDRARYRFLTEDRTSSELRELSVRALDAEPAEIAAISRLLQDRFRLLPAAHAKPFRALAARPDGPPLRSVADEPILLAAPVGRAARGIAARQLRILRENDPGTRLGEDPEALHDLRVAVRRLRASLRAFGDGIPAKTGESLREDLRWLGGLLGPVRDFDVRTARLAESRLLLPEAQRSALAPYAAYLREERELLRAELLEGMESTRYLRLLARLERFTETDVARTAAEPLGRIAHRSLRLLSDRLAKGGRAAAKSPSADALHELRIRAKRLRYVLGSLEETLGKHAHRLARSLARLQDSLGAHRDAVAAAEALSRWASGIPPSQDPGLLLSIGALIGMETARAERALRDFDEAWKRWTSKRSRKDLEDAIARAAR
jgi:CHAD domain-containing protein